jgi:maleate isomerase
MHTKEEPVSRLRVALLLPSPNTVMEGDLYSGLPNDQFTVHANRMYLVECTRDAERRMIEEFAPRAADDLGTLKPDVLVFGCTSGGSLFGIEYDARICRELGQRAGCHGLGVISAVAEALERQTRSRLAIITPYNEDLTRSVASAVSAGREIVCAYGMGIEDTVALADPTPAEIVAFARERLTGKTFDGIFVSCTNFRSFEARKALSEAFGVPVVTSNGAVVDALQRFRDVAFNKSRQDRMDLATR